MLPAELQAPPPRNPAAAEKFVARNRQGLKGVALGLVLFPLLLLVAGFLGVKRMTPASGLGIGLIVDVFLVLFLFTFWLQLKRSLKVFVEGQATLATVLKVDMPGGGGGGATYIIIDLEYVDAAAQRWVGKTATTGTKIRCAAGDRVPLLYLPDQPQKFALYDSEVGMVPGVAKKG